MSAPLHGREVTEYSAATSTGTFTGDGTESTTTLGASYISTSTVRAERPQSSLTDARPADSVSVQAPGPHASSELNDLPHVRTPVEWLLFGIAFLLATGLFLALAVIIFFLATPVVPKRSTTTAKTTTDSTSTTTLDINTVTMTSETTTPTAITPTTTPSTTTPTATTTSTTTESVATTTTTDTTTPTTTAPTPIPSTITPTPTTTSRTTTTTDTITPRTGPTTPTIPTTTTPTATTTTTTTQSITTTRTASTTTITKATRRTTAAASPTPTAKLTKTPPRPGIRAPECALSGHVNMFCSNGAISKWYFDRKTNSCVETAYQYSICSNVYSYTTYKICKDTCGLGPKLQQPECQFGPRFEGCNYRHLQVTPYYLNPSSDQCEQWDFPRGACPGHNTWYDQAQCTRNCVGAKNPDPLCNRPTGVRACRPSEMKFPFFYSKALKSTGDCHEKSKQLFGGHLCPNTKNVFDTQAECEIKCPQ